MRFIQNLLAATAATKMEDSENSSDDSDAEQWENLDVKAGSMELVRQTLQGMASRNTDEGVKAMGIGTGWCPCVSLSISPPRHFVVPDRSY